MKGDKASVWILSYVGAIMKNVRNKERPTTIWFGGSWGMPMACLRKDKTITILVNELIRRSMAGAKARMVSRRAMLMRLLLLCPPVSELKRSSFAGDAGFCRDTGFDCTVLLTWARARQREGIPRRQIERIPTRRILILRPLPSSMKPGEISPCLRHQRRVCDPLLP